MPPTSPPPMHFVHGGRRGGGFFLKFKKLDLSLNKLRKKPFHTYKYIQ